MESNPFGCSFGLGVSKFVLFVKDPLLSVKEVFATQDLTTLFQLPLSERAHSEFMSLQLLMSDFSLDFTKSDVWMWREDGKPYTAKK